MPEEKIIDDDDDILENENLIEVEIHKNEKYHKYRLILSDEDYGYPPDLIDIDEKKSNLTLEYLNYNFKDEIKEILAIEKYHIIPEEQYGYIHTNLYELLGYKYVINDCLEKINSNVVKVRGTESYNSEYYNDIDFTVFVTRESNDSNEELRRKRLSLILRGNETLTIEKSNQFKCSRYTVIFDGKGIAIIFKDTVNKSEEKEIREHITILYLLCITYIHKDMNFINEINKQVMWYEYGKLSNKQRKRILKNYEEVNELRTAILFFDCKYYFKNPVKINRNDYYLLWNHLSDFFHVHELHNEIKEKCFRLTDFLEMYYRELRIEYQIKQEKEEENNKELLEKQKEINQTFQTKMSWGGLIIGICSLWTSVISTIPIIAKFFK